jgi:glutathione synthase/RimK-type ligase-like ATP-grasp enzyme
MISADAKKILIISDEFDPHVDHMVVLLKSLNVECLRWSIDSFPLQSTIDLALSPAGLTGEIRTAHWTAEFATIRSVWLRHPNPPILPSNLSEEERRFATAETRSALAGLYRVSNWFWVNSPDKVRIASSKPLQLKRASQLGFRIPQTLITNNPQAVRVFFESHHRNIIYKPFSSPFFDENKKVCYTTPISARDLDHIGLIKNAPGIFQENIPKKIELRITVIGREVFATEIHSQQAAGSKHDWRAGDIADLPHARHELPKIIEQKCLAFIESFDLAYGAIDMILTPQNDYVFLENNPIGQFGWIEDKTEQPLTATLARMLIAGEIL